MFFENVNTDIKHRANGKIAISQVNRSWTLNKSLRVAGESEVIDKSSEENTLMTQGNMKVIVKSNLFGTRKLWKFFNYYTLQILENDILRQSYFSINVATALY